MANEDLVSIVQEYRKRGWRVFPLHSVNEAGTACSCYKGAACRNKGKHPKNEHWRNEPPMSGPDIQDTWGIEVGTPPNVGIATGSDSGLVIPDFDVKSGGMESFEKMKKDGLIRATYLVRTGGGGFHAYYSTVPDHRLTNSNVALRQAGYVGVDMRGEGGYVVAPPSRTDKGTYEVIRDGDVAPPVMKLVEILEQPEHEHYELPGERLDLTKGQREYFKAGVQRELDRLQRMAAMAQPRGEGYRGEPWDDTCFEIACNLLELGNTIGIDLHADFMRNGPQDSGFQSADLQAKWDSAVKKIGTKMRALPDDDNDWLDGATPTLDRAAVDATDPDASEETRDLAFEHAVAVEKFKIEVRDEARSQVRLATAMGIDDEVDAKLMAGSVIKSDDAIIEPVWGDPENILWSRGESCMISARSGVGKTTLAGLLVRGLLVGGDVFGLPVAQYDRVIYLAMDRPGQIKLALRRQLGDIEDATLDEKFKLWRGSVSQSPVDNREVYVDIVRRAFGDISGLRVAMVVDSLKDAAIGLSEDSVGAGYNRARQYTTENGIDLLELHHQVKRNAEGKDPNNIEDVYGSSHLTNGAGSVILLNGRAGDLEVTMKHVKQPMGEVGPWKVAIDHRLGTMTKTQSNDLMACLRQTRIGLTTKEVAEILYDTDRPTPSDVKKAERELRKLVRKVYVYEHKGERGNHDKPTRWTYLSQRDETLIADMIKLPCSTCGELVGPGDDGEFKHDDGGRGTPVVEAAGDEGEVSF